MASFCKQCSEELFGEDFGDYRGVTSPSAWLAGFACIVVCEGCGAIQVDPNGACVSSDCLRAGHAQDRESQHVDSARRLAKSKEML